MPDIDRLLDHQPGRRDAVVTLNLDLSAAEIATLVDEKAVTAIALMHRARAWFAAHGITHIERIVNNGFRAEAFARALLGSRHQRITPYTPRHNGKVERVQPDHLRGVPPGPDLDLRGSTP